MKAGKYCRPRNFEREITSIKNTNKSIPIVRSISRLIPNRSTQRLFTSPTAVIFRSFSHTHKKSPANCVPNAVTSTTKEPTTNTGKIGFFPFGFSAMAISSITTNCPSLLRFSYNSKQSSSSPQISVSFRFSRSSLSCGKPLSVRATTVPAAPTSEGLAPAITLTDDALKHLNKMRAERDEDLCLRIGVKQGGCSGMSYTMDFEKRASARPDDSIIEYNGFTIICDPKSLLFLFGMQLDYSDALIGGGFSFKNPNATQTCGCGKSFAAEM